jgi:hypothetical protein
LARHRDFACLKRCDLPHRLRQAKKSRSGINPGLNMFVAATEEPTCDA